VLLSFNDAITERSWSKAEQCLSSRGREVLSEPLKDRTFFDGYIDGSGPIPLWYLRNNTNFSVNIEPYGGVKIGCIYEQEVFSTEGFSPKPVSIMVLFVKEENGWKIHPRFDSEEQFLKYYEGRIRERFKGKAKELENISVEQTN
jgi:hypothetical protein